MDLAQAGQTNAEAIGAQSRCRQAAHTTRTTWSSKRYLNIKVLKEPADERSHHRLSQLAVCSLKFRRNGDDIFGSLSLLAIISSERYNLF